MTQRNKIIFWTSVSISFLAGLFLGRFWKYYSLIKWDNKVDIVSGLGLLVTIGIAIIIPLMVKKIIDDNSGIKSFLVDEIKDLITIFKNICLVVSNAHDCGSFKTEDRDNINYLFHEAELKVDSIEDQMEVSFNNQADEIITGLKSSLLTYKDFLTGGELMNSSFVKVDERFYRENSNEHSKTETGLKMTVHKVYRL